MELESLNDQGADATTAQLIRKMSRENPKAFNNIAGAISGRRLAVTNKFYFSLVPTTAKRGDKVCVLYGFAVPFILPKVTEHYILIGDCYIHGLMQGETLTANPPPTIQNIILH